AHPCGRGLPKTRQAKLEAVLVHRDVAERPDQFADRALRRWTVGVAGAQVDQVDTGGAQPQLRGGDAGQGILREGLEAGAETGHAGSMATGLERRPTPGISTSMTSPARTGPTPSGVPVR